MVDAGKSDPRKGAAGRDRVQSRRNPHLETRLPDRDKEDARERSVEQRLRKKLAGSDLRAPNATYDVKDMEAVLELRREGFTLHQIASREGMPSRRTLGYWLDQNPEFKEASNRAFNDFVREQAEKAVSLAESLSNLRGVGDDILEDALSIGKGGKLKPFEKVHATEKRVRSALLHAATKGTLVDKHIQRALQAAAAKLPGEWGKNADEEREVIVMEVSGGWNPAAASAVGRDDPDGQGPDAWAAKQRWALIRERKAGIADEGKE